MSAIFRLNPTLIDRSITGHKVLRLISTSPKNKNAAAVSAPTAAASEQKTVVANKNWFNFSRPMVKLYNTTTNVDQVLKITDICQRKVDALCSKAKEPTYLRIIVDGGGCSGFQYKFELDNKMNDDDVAFGPTKRVIVDAISLDYCAGSTLDYQVELIKSGFRIVSNPKAEQGCSCGASFALKI